MFGTDGVRGVAGEEITAQLALSLGRAAALQSPSEHPRVLVVRDTRESGEMLEAAVAAGAASAGGEVLLGGVLPTPAAPLLLRRYGFELAVVLSASHNHYRDNGIKLFGADGFKLSDADEQAIERRLERDDGAGGEIGRIRRMHGTADDYLRELQLRFQSLSLEGLDVALDCANGATYRIAPEIFTRLGARVSTIATEPDGRNINAGCGSTHIERLQEVVEEGDHRLGFAYDGDGDRVLAVDASGAVVDGDELLALCAPHLRELGRLPGDGVAVTVMTNFGFHIAMREAGIEVASTAVGDRYVLEELRRRGWAFGGEQSGHLIELGFGPSGDGIAASLLVLEALGGQPLHERRAMQKLPQRLRNVSVRERDALERSPGLQAAIEAAARGLEGRGRLLVRPSGTEALVRVMTEAPTQEEADRVCDELAELIGAQLG